MLITIDYLKGSRDIGNILSRVRGYIYITVNGDAYYVSHIRQRTGASFRGWRQSGRDGGTVSGGIQRFTTRSTGGSEYVAKGEGGTMDLYIRAVRLYVQPQLSGTWLRLYEDNEGTKALAELCAEQAHRQAQALSVQTCGLGLFRFATSRWNHSTPTFER